MADATLNKLNKTNHNGRFLITSFLQLRESDLFAPPLPRPCRSVEVEWSSDHSHFKNASKSLKWRGASPSSHSSFCEEVFSSRVCGTNEVDRTNILAPGV